MLFRSGTKKGFFINSLPQGATVHIEGEMIGKTPCLFPYDLSGKYRLSAEKRGYENWSEVYNFGKGPIDTIFFALRPKNRFRAMLHSVEMPGWGQRYSERHFKGKLFLTIQTTALVSLGLAQINYNKRLNEYNDWQEKYKLASRSFVAEKKAWKELSQAHARLSDASDYRQIMVYSAAAVYVLNVLDALFLYRSNLRQIEIVGTPLSSRSADSFAAMIKISCQF